MPTIRANMSKMPRVLMGIIAALVMVMSVATSQADAVKLGGFWIENVHIIEITPEAILYASATGQEQSRPLIELKGFKMTAYPQLAQADELMAQGGGTKKLRKALKALTTVRAKAKNKKKWLAHWVGLRAMQIEQQLGDNLAAARSFLQLAQTGADVSYLKQPPIGAYQAADAKERSKIISLYRGSLGRLTGPAKVVIGQIVTLLEKIPAPPAPPTHTPLTPTPHTPAPTHAAPHTPPEASEVAPPARGSAQTPTTPAVNTNVLAPLAQTANGQADKPEAVLLPVGTPSNDPVAQLLREGQFDQSIDMLDKTLNGSGARMSMRLYQMGVAQLAKAEQSGQASDYMDAGISFARVLFYFPDTAVWVGPSMVELAYVHQKIGQTAKAADLYDNAINNLDEEEDPAYFARVQQLLESLNPVAP